MSVPIANRRSFSGDGGPATAAKISQSVGVAADAVGNIYFADDNNHRIRFIDYATPQIGIAATTNVGGGAGTGSVSFTTTPAGSYWAASSNASWLTLPTSSGTGAASLGFSYSGNTTGVSRGAVITINGVAATVTQAAISGTVSISGQVTLSGAGLAGATVTLTGGSSGTRTTDGSGNYSFTGLATGGNYTVAASLLKFTIPNSGTFTNIQSNQTANFTATLTRPGFDLILVNVPLFGMVYLRSDAATV